MRRRAGLPDRSPASTCPRSGYQSPASTYPRSRGVLRGTRAPVSDTMMPLPGHFRVSCDGAPLESRTAAGIWRSINPGCLRARAPTRVRGHCGPPVRSGRPNRRLGLAGCSRCAERLPRVWRRARRRQRCIGQSTAAQTFAENAVSRRRRRLRATPLEEA